TTIGVAGAATLNLPGPISGAPLIKSGPGILFLSGPNTYGGLTINGGGVAVSSNANLGAGFAPVAINKATLRATSTFTTPRPFVVGAATSTIYVDGGSTMSVSGMIAGATSTSRVLKSGPGKLVLGGSNMMAGGVTLQE